MSNATSYKDSSQYEIPRKTNTLFFIKKNEHLFKEKGQVNEYLPFF